MQHHSDRSLNSRDCWLAALFVALSMLGYATTRTRLAYLWDSVEFALAINDYNVAMSQPHAPGYFLYVMLGRAVNSVVGDPHASLVWMSVAGGGLLVGVVYLLGVALFGRNAGLAAACITWTSPMVWFYSSVALTYTVDAALVTALVFLCWRAKETGMRWGCLLGITVLFTLIGGIRQQSIPGLLLIVGVALWSARQQRGWKIAVFTGLWLALTAIWVGCMLHMIGGWEAYWGPVQQISRFHAHKTLVGGGITALLWNIFFAVLYCFNGLLLSGGILLAVILRGKGAAFASGYRWIVMWIAPVFIIATFVGYSEAPGHVFTYLPGLFLLVGLFIGQLRLDVYRWIVLTLVCGVNLVSFWAWPVNLDGALWGTLRTRGELRNHDAALVRTVATIRGQFNPATTVVCHVHGNLLYGLRHFQFYLPEFRQVRLDPDFAMVRPPGREFLMTQDGRSEFVRGFNPQVYQQLVMVIPDENARVSFERRLDLSSARVIQDSLPRLIVVNRQAWN